MTDLRRVALPALLALTWVACGDGVSPDGGVDEPDGRVTMDGETPPPADTGPQCESDRGCDDGDYCNGTERCLPGSAEAGPNGCAPGAPPCDEATEICDEAADRCTLDECSDGGDADGDLDPRPACGGSDCDDNNPNVYSTAQEVCDEDGVDEDCHPETIRSEAPGLEDGDVDGDGYVDVACFNTRADGTEHRGRDCDDLTAAANPRGVESCDLVDNDCDGRVDEGVLEIYYRDEDGDGYGCDPADPLALVCSAAPVEACSAPAGFVGLAGDCDDRPADGTAVHPGAVEVCNMGRDDDCDGMERVGCACSIGEMRDCGPPGPLMGNCRRVSQACVDGAWPGTCESSGAVFPRRNGSGGLFDPCGGGDEDCDGTVDEDDRTPYFRDDDSDGYGDPVRRMDFCPGDDTTGYVRNSLDCDDTSVMVRPGVGEVCDSVDQDCDGRVDESPTDLGTREHCSACNDECQFRCDHTRSCDLAEEISHSHRATCARTVGGRVYCWGPNSDGAVGDGRSTIRWTPYEVPLATNAIDVHTFNGTTCAVDMYAGVYCWGRNSSGQVGNGTLANQTTPQHLGTAAGRHAVSIGGGTVCAYDGPTPAEPVRCWGEFAPWADVGGTWRHDSSSSPRTMSGIGYSPAGIAMNYVGGALIDPSGSVLSWGGDYTAGRGPTPSLYYYEPEMVVLPGPVSEIHAAAHTTCALVSGEVYCWGSDEAGQLGDGPGSPDACPVWPCSYTPQRVTGLPPIARLFVGPATACAQSAGGETYCWGDNPSTPPAPPLPLAPTTMPGVTVGRYDSPTRVPLLDGYESISFSTSPHGCGVDDGIAYCWGGARGVGNTYFVGLGINRVLPPG